MTGEYKVRRCDCGNVMKIRISASDLTGATMIECLDHSCYIKSTRVRRSRKKLAPSPVRVKNRKFIHCSQCKGLRKLDMFEKMVDP